MIRVIGVILLFSLISCDKGNRCFDRPGELDSRTESIDGNLNDLNLYDDLNYYLINDSLNYIEITGGSNLIHNIIINIESYNLDITNTNKCLFTSNKDAVDVTIHYSSLNQLNLYGYGDINSIGIIPHNLKINGTSCYSTITLNVRNDSTYVSIEGAPQLTLSGSGEYIYAYTVGKGNYFLEHFYTNHAHAHNKGIGDIHISADSTYIIEMRSRGDIYLYDTLNTERSIYLEGEGQVFYQ